MPTTWARGPPRVNLTRASSITIGSLSPLWTTRVPSIQ